MALIDVPCFSCLNVITEGRVIHTINSVYVVLDFTLGEILLINILFVWTIDLQQKWCISISVINMCYIKCYQWQMRENIQLMHSFKYSFIHTNRKSGSQISPTFAYKNLIILPRYVISPWTMFLLLFPSICPGKKKSHPKECVPSWPTLT